MSCESQFPSNVSFTCILKLIGQTRSGLSLQILKEWIWVAGCLVEKFAPITLPPTAEVQKASTENLDEMLSQLEELCAERIAFEETPLFMAEKASFNWAVLIPIVLKIVEMVLDKYTKPAPAPAPAPKPTK